MAYNRINPIAKSIGIASLAYALSACGGQPEKELEKEVDDYLDVSFPWHALMCEELRQGLQNTNLSSEESQYQVRRCENECSPPGREASWSFCADLYCCFQSAGYEVSLCEYDDSLKDKGVDYIHYLQCMERFKVKPPTYCDYPLMSPAYEKKLPFSCFIF